MYLLYTEEIKTTTTTTTTLEIFEKTTVNVLISYVYYF